MPQKGDFFTALLECYRQHSQTVQSIIVALLCVVASAFYTGAKWKKVMADVIFCPLIAVVLGNRVPPITLFGITVDHTIIAALVGTAGMHGVHAAAIWAMDKRDQIAKFMAKQSD